MSRYIKPVLESLAKSAPGIVGMIIVSFAFLFFQERLVTDFRAALNTRDETIKYIQQEGHDQSRWAAENLQKANEQHVKIVSLLESLLLRQKD